MSLCKLEKRNEYIEIADEKKKHAVSVVRSGIFWSRGGGSTEVRNVPPKNGG